MIECEVVYETVNNLALTATHTRDIKQGLESTPSERY